MSGEQVRLAVEGAVAVITLARPEKLNALTFAMLERLASIADELERSETVRVALLTGEGPKAFCAGADIAEWGELSPLAFGRRWLREGHRIFDRLARLRQPLIAVLNGMALGGGLELAATADLRLAEAHVRIGLPETRVGVLPGWSGTQRLVRRVGPAAVKRLIFLGDPIDADEALRLGFVDLLYPTGEAMTAARTMALKIAERAPVPIGLAKQLVNAAEGEEEPSAILESLAGAFTATTEDVREGTGAFKEKRAPRFVGR